MIVDEEDFHVVDEPDDIEPDVVIDGPAAALECLAVAPRATTASCPSPATRTIHQRFLAVVAHPIN